MRSRLYPSALYRCFFLDTAVRITLFMLGRLEGAGLLLQVTRALLSRKASKTEARSVRGDDCCSWWWW